MKYEIVLTIRNEDKFESLDKVQADDLLHLVSQFTFVVLNIQRKEYEKQINELESHTDINNDIPF